MDLTSPENSAHLLRLSLVDPLLRPLVPLHRRAASDAWWTLIDHLLTMATAGSEPALRHIRLAWWRDALAQLGNGQLPPDPRLRAVEEHVVGQVPSMILAQPVERMMDALASGWAADDVMTLGKTIFCVSDRILCIAEGERGADSPADPSSAGGAAWACARIGGLTGAGAGSELWSAGEAAFLARGRTRALCVLDRLALSIAQRRGVRRRWAEQAVVLRVGLLGR